MRYGKIIGLWLIALGGVAPAMAQPAPGATAQPALGAMPPAVESLIDGLQPEAGLRRGIRLPSAAPAAGLPIPGTPDPGLTATTAPPGVAAIALRVNFATGAATLTPEAEQVLTNLGAALASPQLAGFRFRVEGHSDTVGGRAPNQALSERRAQAVRNNLIQRHGIAASRLEAIGLGEQQPLVPTPDETPEPRNRRVQILNLGG